MIKWARSKIGIQLLITFSVVLVLSMVSLTYIATRMVEEFGKFSADSNEISIRKNTNAFMARITHEQAMRYESIFKKFATASATIAKQATFYLDHTESYGAKPLKPNEKLLLYPHNGIFSNDNSKKTMVLYWGSPTMSQDISEQIKTLSHIDPLLETIKEENPESVACYVVTEPGLTRYYPNIHGVEKLPPTTKFDIRNANWYWIAKPENNLERKTKWSNIYLDSVGQGLLITASTPLYSKSGEYLGASGVDVTLNTIVNDIIRNIPSCHKMEGLFSFLIDNQGRLIAFPPEYLDMFEIKIHQDKLKDASIVLQHSILDSSNSEIRRIGETMLKKNFQVSGFVLNRQHYLISSHFMPSTGWRLGVVVSESVVLASVQELRNTADLTIGKMTSKFALLTALLLIFAIIVIVVFSIKNFIKPLDKLSKSALRVKEGDLTTHVDIYTKNEIGSLAKIFNNMIDTLREVRDQEKTHTEKLEQKVKNRTQKLQIKNEEQKSTLQKLKQEILERKQIDEALKASEKKYLSLFQNAQVALFRNKLSDGKVLEINERYAKMAGYSNIEDCMTEFNAADAWADPKGRKELLRVLQENGFVRDYETEIVRRDGTNIWISFSATIFPEQGFLEGSIVEITERKRSEIEREKLQAQLNQAQKMESIGTLAGGIAHDFNNILFPIVGHTEMLMEDSPENSPFRDNLNEIYTGALRARDLVQQILAFSRQGASELKLMKMQVIIKEALKLIRSTIPTTISINQNIQPDCGAIKADPTQIHQIVMNLTTNAYHAMEEAGGELKVGLKEVELGQQDLIYTDLTPGRYACLTISDTGIGITKDVIDKIFVPFFTTKEKGKGTGMGLSVVHGIIKNMSGKIEVDSELGKGTEFYVYLPIAESTFKIEESPIKEPIRGGDERILLVDDEELIIKMEKQALERLGYRVTSRNSSIDALETFRDSPDKFNLVITDMAMPKMSGDKLAVELIKIRPDIPILLCTGFSEAMTEEKIKSLGIKDLLLKPIIMKDLSQKIRSVLDTEKKGTK